MATPVSAPTVPAEHSAIPAALLNVCFVLCVINVSYFPAAYFSQWWIWDPTGLGIPTGTLSRESSATRFAEVPTALRA